MERRYELHLFIPKENNKTRQSCLAFLQTKPLFADHSDDDLQRRRLRRAAFGALCNSSEPNVKKLFLVPATVLSSKSEGNGPTPDHASWFMDTWFMDTDEILVEYFVLSSKVVFTAKNGKESKDL